MDKLVQTKHCSIAINSRGQPSRVVCQKLSASVDNFNGFGDWLLHETFKDLSFYWGIIRDAARKKKLGVQQNGSVKQRNEKTDW